MSTLLDDATVTITTPACMVCRKTSEVELTVDEYAAYKHGDYIQVALSSRSDDFRELVKSGTHSECWDTMFADDEDDEDYEQ